MPVFTDASGNKVNAIIPSWNRLKIVDSQVKISKEQRRDRNARVLIENNKCSYVFVPRYLADKKIDANEAIEITKDDPDYPQAFRKAYGDRTAGFVNGERIPHSSVLETGLEAELAEIIAMENSAKLKASASNGQTSTGIMIPQGVSDVVSNVRPRGRPRKIHVFKK